MKVYMAAISGANRGRAMNEVVTREEAKLRSRDMDRVREAALRIEKLSRRIKGWITSC